MGAKPGAQFSFMDDEFKEGAETYIQRPSDVSSKYRIGGNSPYLVLVLRWFYRR